MAFFVFNGNQGRQRGGEPNVAPYGHDMHDMLMNMNMKMTARRRHIRIALVCPVGRGLSARHGICSGLGMAFRFDC